MLALESTDLIQLEQLVILALVQGITEFLPVSSSAHLALLPSLIGAPDQGLLVDVAAHGGTLCAVLLYFRMQIGRMVTAVTGLAPAERSAQDSRLFWMLMVASLPVVIAGAAMWYYGLVDEFRSPKSIAAFTIIFGVLLYAGDRWGDSGRTMKDVGPWQAMLIGCAQALALIPGVSRAGVTVTASRVLGIHREDSARFSFLLAIPAVGAAFALGVFEIWRHGDVSLSLSALTVFALSLASALAAIWGMLWVVRRFRLTVFAIYRIVLGVAILIFSAG